MSYSFGLIKVFAHSQEGFFHCSCLFHFQIIETTGCTQAQAEIALLDTDNNLYGAIDHILDAGDKLDSWTEQKGAKKEKKKPEEGSYNNRGFVARGRGSCLIEIDQILICFFQVEAPVSSIEEAAGDPMELQEKAEIIIGITVIIRKEQHHARLEEDLKNRMLDEVEEVAPEVDILELLLHHQHLSQMRSLLILMR